MLPSNRLTHEPNRAMSRKKKIMLVTMVMMLIRVPDCRLEWICLRT
jgi:hypothetical protein